MPAGGAQAAEDGSFGGHRIDVERLGIELPGEADDLIRGHVISAVVEDFAHGEILEMKNAGPHRRTQRAKRKCRTSPSATT